MNSYLYNKRSITTAVDEFDFLERIKPSAIMEYFQDSATLHASEIGVGFEEVKKQNLCWVLNRLSATIDRCPTIGEDLTITTFPHAPGSVDAIRDYYITDADGNSLIRGTSRWCVLDIANKAIRRCSTLFRFDATQYNPEFALPTGNPQLPDIKTVAGENNYNSGKVYITDLDRNGHMNNARYADIVVNSCDYDFYATHSIKSFDFNFLSEMKIDDQYNVYVKTVESTSYYEARGVQNDKVIFRAKVLWA